MARVGIPPTTIKKDARLKEIDNPLKEKPVVGTQSNVPSQPVDTQHFVEGALELNKVEGSNADLAIQALRQQIDQLLDLSAAQLVLQNARQRLKQNPDWTSVDAAHQEIAKKPMPTSPRELVEVLLNRLGVGGKERETVFKAVDLVLAGAVVPTGNMEAIGGSTSSHDFSTQMAVTDEGYDHVLMTLADPRMLNGAWTHIERINRVDQTGQGTPHAYPYALPPEQLVGLIRLLQGGDAPSTVFYGSPNYRPSAIEEDVPKGHDDQETAGLHNNAEKAIRELQMVARYAFERGVSEVKVSMDGLSEKEAIKFMKEVSGPLNLDKDRYYLSGAFNLPNGLVDLGVGKPLKGAPTAKDQEKLLEVGLKAIEITAQGGFGKVTLDSASMTPPSYPLIEYFGVANLLEWAHQAHQSGLETYVSGGMQAYHFPLLAMTGVDGVGVGTSIHESTPFSGITGRLAPGRVHDALSRRDQTEHAEPGQVMYLLRRLDDKVGKGIALNDVEKRLQSSAHQLLTGFAKKVDVGLATLKQARDGRVAELTQAKKNGTLSDTEFAAQSKAARDEFGRSFEALVAESLSEPGFVAECQKLAAQGAQFGYPRRSAEGGQ